MSLERKITRFSVYLERVRSLEIVGCDILYALCEVEAAFFVPDGDDFSFEIFAVQEF